MGALDLASLRPANRGYDYQDSATAFHLALALAGSLLQLPSSREVLLCVGFRMTERSESVGWRFPIFDEHFSG